MMAYTVHHYGASKRHMEYAALSSAGSAHTFTTASSSFVVEAQHPYILYGVPRIGVGPRADPVPAVHGWSGQARAGKKSASSSVRG